MVSRRVASTSVCWRAYQYLLLIVCLSVTTPFVASAQTSTTKTSGELPFNVFSNFFARTTQPTGEERRTRLTIDLRREETFEIFSLKDPNRLVIEMPQVGMRLPDVGPDHSMGLVKGITAGQAAPGRARIVIDVTEPVFVARSEMKPHPGGNGAQLELDLLPLGATSKAVRSALKRPAFSLGGPLPQPPLPPRAADRNTKTAYKPLIVIDPGHGGKDPGAQKFGINEKDVVLAFGKTLREHLEETGRYRVKMTRSSDVFIPLDERREFAEDHTAALFIAVHADYAGSNARGATIYSLRRELANSLRESAAADAAKDAISGTVLRNVSANNNDLSAVRGILGDLAQREVHATLERTNIFTQIAVDQMGATTMMRSKPHRQAAFKVLKTAKVPSVLIELAYVSNRRDAARLQSQSWRNEVSGSLVAAIDKYFSQSLSQIAQ